MTSGKKVVFEKDSIYLEENPNSFVMMNWETELMKEHAKIVCSGGGDILEIGFGMGIFSNFVQQYSIKSHTIVESNPQIHQKLIEWSQNYNNVTIIFGDWYKIFWKINQKKYDGIFYDADCSNIQHFRAKVVDRSLREDGIFSYFAPDGKDSYFYGNRLNQYSINISCEIPKNAYHNDKLCSVNWIKY